MPAADPVQQEKCHGVESPGPTRTGVRHAPRRWLRSVPMALSREPPVLSCPRGVVPELKRTLVDVRRGQSEVFTGLRTFADFAEHADGAPGGGKFEPTS